MHAFRQDLLLGFRSLRREPASAIIASLTLALGIGLCTTSFSLGYGVFGRGHPVPESSRLVMVGRSNPVRDIEWMAVSAHDYYDWKAQQTSFEGIAAFRHGTVNLAGGETPERYEGIFATANLLEVLKIRPAVGSGFRSEDELPGAPLTVVIGYDIWTTRYASDPKVVGTSVLVNGEAASIVGVMPKGIYFPEDETIWIIQRDTRGEATVRGRGTQFQVMGRLKAGVSKDQAAQEMALIANRLAQAYPQSNKDITARIQTMTEDNTGPELRAVFGAMQVATLFVLLIAIANVSNLLLARATLRTREAAVRSALGASRWRIVLPFFAETSLLAVIGAVFGTAIAYGAVRLFDGATQNVGKPYYMTFAIDFPILVFIVAVTFFTALVAGAAPAFHVLKTDVQSTLKDESRGSSGILGLRLTKVLVAAEIALSCALLIGAGLMVKSITRLRTFEYPYRTEGVFTARLGIFDNEYQTPELRSRFWVDLGNRLSGLPGTVSATLTTNLPANNSGEDVVIQGQQYSSTNDYPVVQTATVAPGFFRTFGTSLLRGRDFTVNDAASSEPVAIVNASFAARFFPGKEALGQRFAETVGRDSVGAWKTIVGIAPDLRMEGFDSDRPGPYGYYTPLAQRDIRFASMAIQVSGVDPMRILPGVREAVRGLNPNLPIFDVLSMDGVIRQASWFYVVFGSLFIAFGAAALFMATVGLYGVLAFSVSRRMREMGIRMALGANARDVIGLVLRQGGRQLAVGLLLGLVMAFGLTRVIGLLMFEVQPSDPVVFGGVVLVISAVGLLASFLPARRATRAEPVAALRAE